MQKSQYFFKKNKENRAAMEQYIAMHLSGSTTTSMTPKIIKFKFTEKKKKLAIEHYLSLHTISFTSMPQNIINFNS